MAGLIAGPYLFSQPIAGLPQLIMSHGVIHWALCSATPRPLLGVSTTSSVLNTFSQGVFEFNSPAGISPLNVVMCGGRGLNETILGCYLSGSCPGRALLGAEDVFLCCCNDLLTDHTPASHRAQPGSIALWPPQPICIPFPNPLTQSPPYSRDMPCSCSHGHYLSTAAAS